MKKKPMVWMGTVLAVDKPMAKITKGYPQLMPTYEGQVGEEQILELIAYVRSLRSPGGGR